jgi:hypothetical protein
MIKTVPIASAAVDVAINTAALAGFADLPGRIAGPGQIVGCEHCSACAYPKCYEARAFCTPRSVQNERVFASNSDRSEHVSLRGCPSRSRTAMSWRFTPTSPSEAR